MPVCARPVRTLASSLCRFSIDFAMRVSALFLTSATLMLSSLDVNQGTFVVSHDNTGQRPWLVDGKHLDWQFLIPTQRKRRRIHDLEATIDGLVKTDARITRGGGIFIGIGTVDAVDTGGLQDDFG